MSCSTWCINSKSIFTIAMGTVDCTDAQYHTISCTKVQPQHCQLSLHLPLNRKQVCCWGIFLSMLRLITSSYSFQSIAVRLKTSEIQIKPSCSVFHQRSYWGKAFCCQMKCSRSENKWIKICSILAKQLSRHHMRNENDGDGGDIFAVIMMMRTSSQIQPAGGHPHSHTRSQLTEICITLIMQG